MTDKLPTPTPHWLVAIIIVSPLIVFAAFVYVIEAVF